MAVNAFRVEAWSLPIASSAKLVHSVPIVAGQIEDPLANGRGQITVPADWDRLSEVSPAIFRVFRDGTLIPYVTFVGKRDASKLRDKDSANVVISGPNITDYIMSGTRIENFDYPDRPTVDPDWLWGLEQSVRGFRNGSFEAAEEIPGIIVTEAVTDFESGTLEGWEVIPSGGDFRASDTTPILTTDEAYAGTYSLEFDGGTRHSGVRKKIIVKGGEQYTFSMRLKSATTGKRFTFGIDLPAGGTHAHSNGFVYNGIAMAELGNVARNPAHNGLPGGSTDGTWQLMSLDVTMPTFSNPYNSAEIYLYVQYDHHDASNGPVAYIDGFAGSGPSLDMAPWINGGDFVTFEQDSGTLHGSTSPDDETYALKYEPSAATGGVYQVVEGLTPGRMVTFRFKITHAEGSAHDFTAQVFTADGGSLIGENTESVPVGDGWTDIAVTVELTNQAHLFKISSDDAIEFWADTAKLGFGMQAATWGDIWQQLMDDAASDHSGEAGKYAWSPLAPVDYTGWTAVLDSGGNAWPGEVSYRARRGKSYKQISSDGWRMGYEYRIRDTVATALTLEMDLYNPYDFLTRTGGFGTNRVGTGVPTIGYGEGTADGEIVNSPNVMNRFHVEGENGLWDIEKDATSITAHGERDGYEGDRNILSAATVTEVAEQLLAERINPTTSIKINLNPGDNPELPLPYRDFQVGDTYPLHIADSFVGALRVVRITTNVTDTHAIYTIEFDNTVYTTDPMKATIEAVRRILEKFDELDGPEDDTGPALAIPDGIDVLDPTYTIAPFDADPANYNAASFKLSGTSDEETLQAAATALNTLGRGRLVVLEGTVNFASASKLTLPPDVSFFGVGPGTLITYLTGPASGYLIEYGDRSMVGRFRLKDRSTS